MDAVTDTEDLSFFAKYKMSPEVLKTVYYYFYVTLNSVANTVRRIVFCYNPIKTLFVIGLFFTFSFFANFMGDYWILLVVGNILLLTPYVVNNHMNTINEMVNKR